jgi:hypothetical protein
MDMCETEDKEAEWILFLLQNPPGYEFLRKFNKDYEEKTIPKLKVIADKLALYSLTTQIISYYYYCDFKDEDRTLYNKAKEHPHLICQYLKEIDKDIEFKIKAIPQNIPYIAKAWKITGKGFEVFEKLIKNKTGKKEPTLNQIREVRDNIILTPKEFIDKALDYLENTDFSEKRYVAMFIAGSVKEQLKYKEEAKKEHGI